MSHDSHYHSVRSHRRIVPQGTFLVGLTFAVLTGVLLPLPVRADLEEDYNLALQFYKQDRWDFAAAKLQQFLEDAPADHAKVPLAKLYLGQALVHQRQFQNARPVFREFVAQHPEHQDVALAMYRVGECSYFLNDFSTAEKELSSFLDHVPADHDLAEWALQYLGETRLQLGRYQQAIQSFENGLEHFEQGQLAEEMRFGLARAYEAAGRPAEARRLYEQIAGGDGRRAADARFNLAAALFENEQYQPAAERFTEIAEKHAEHRIAPLATLNAGYSHYHLGEFTRAMAQFEKVTSDAKLGPTAKYWIGLSLKSQEKYNEAGDALLALYESEKQHTLAESVLFHAADARLGAQDYAAAQQLFQDVFHQWPEGELADDSLHLATEAAMLAGDQQAADELHRRFTEHFPNSGLKLPQELLRGRLLLVEGDQLDGEQAKQKYRDAAETFTGILEQSSIPETQSLATLQLARTWDRLDNPTQVLQTLQPLLKQAGEPNAPDTAWQALAMQSTALLTLKKYEKSIAAANKYLQHQATGPEAAEALANITVAQAHQEQWEVAEESLAKLQATGNRSLSDRITYEVAELAYDAQKWAESADLYQQIVDRDSDGEFYRPALSGLAYCRHQEGRILQQESEEAKAADDTATGTSRLAAAIGKFDEAAGWFAKLVETTDQQQDPVVQSDALYMQGLSLKLARRLPQATKVLLDAAEQFSLPADVQQPSEAQRKAAYNAFRSAREAARAFQENQDLAAADRAYQAAYDQLLKQQPEQQEQVGIDALLNEWALMHYNAQAFDRAGELFAKLIAEQPESIWADDARLLLAEGDYFAEKYQPAQKSLRKLLAEEQTDDFVRQRSLLLLMDIAVRLNEWKEAQSMATQLAEQFPNGEDRWEAEYRRGEAALRLKQFDEAARIVRQLAEQRTDPTLAGKAWLPGVWLLLAEAQLGLQQYAQLMQTADQFGELFPDSSLQYHLDDVRGRAYKNQARFEEARAAFHRVIDSPHGKGTETAAKAQFLIAETHLLEKEYMQAFEAYYRVVSTYGFPLWQARALLQAGKCEEQLKQWQGAAKSYRQLLEEHPRSEYAEEAKRRLKDIEKRFPQTVGP